MSFKSHVGWVAVLLQTASIGLLRIGRRHLWFRERVNLVGVELRVLLSHLVLLDMQNVLTKLVCRQNHLVLDVDQLLGSQVLLLGHLLVDEAFGGALAAGGCDVVVDGALSAVGTHGAGGVLLVYKVVVELGVRLQDALRPLLVGDLLVVDGVL